ncbi:excalibur calcium-binding domain-containing protein [Rhizobiaceae bacterium BDR2-2]|uniref:Excalibur calcium-binding domain-containing protein n=1 Tax=Ectorhizobium quercum TaxID=2965071 RepID=A0AAE3N2B8_9HYPH|nr:excalibur calcium-binding domain-containing protein [Ectorhizobium quercum]MCX8999508.1 excalibur calcium-binding domain-containing protein [Ectorhizobium quercum]
MLPAAILLLIAGFPDLQPQPPAGWMPVAARSCKQVESCEEAVELWCGGYRRADGDGDGIPCENVCRSLEQVEEIRRRIGC